jgi:TonB family protein
MNFSSLKYVAGSFVAAMTIVSLLQACHESYRTANISTTQDRIYDKKETPVNPGVFLLLQEYVLGQINYPPGAMINQVEGTVYVHFTIDNNGNISDIAAIGNRIGYGLEEEAIRVVSEMPVSISSALKGKKGRRILPIVYKIDRLQQIS